MIDINALMWTYASLLARLGVKKIHIYPVVLSAI